MNLYAIRNIKTGEWFVGVRSSVTFLSTGAAANSFNHANSPWRSCPEENKLKNQDDWILVQFDLSEVEYTEVK